MSKEMEQFKAHLIGLGRSQEQVRWLKIVVNTENLLTAEWDITNKEKYPHNSEDVFAITSGQHHD